MIVRMFAIFDSKAEAFLQPFFASTKAVALRNFASAVTQEDSTFHKHAEDYQLFEIALFDDHSGEVKGLEAKLALAYATEFLVNGKRVE